MASLAKERRELDKTQSGKVQEYLKVREELGIKTPPLHLITKDLARKLTLESKGSRSLRQEDKEEARKSELFSADSIVGIPEPTFTVFSAQVKAEFSDLVVVLGDCRRRANLSNCFP